MKKTTFSILAAIALTSSAIAGGSVGKEVMETTVPVTAIPSESGHFYAGIAYSAIDGKVTDMGALIAFGPTGSSYDLDADGIMLQAGYMFNDNLGVEGRYTKSINDAALTATVGADIENYGIYLKPVYPINDFSLYGLLGYGKTSVEATGFSWSNSGFQWGVGGSYNINENVAVFVDYTDWCDDAKNGADVELHAISVGVTYNF